MPLIIFLGLLFFPTPFYSYDIPIQNKVTASERLASSNFGFSVSVSGSMALVGAHHEDIGGNENQGSAYLFDCTSLPCSQVDKLVASDGASGDLFGFSVSLWHASPCGRLQRRWLERLSLFV